MKYLDTAARSPSFDCKHTLINAELSRVKKEDIKKTFALYDKAIKQAVANEYPHILFW